MAAIDDKHKKPVATWGLMSEMTAEIERLDRAAAGTAQGGADENGYTTEFVRADLHAAEIARLTAERDALIEHTKESAEMHLAQMGQMNAEYAAIAAERDAAQQALAEALAEVERLKADREQGNLDYLALQDRYDRKHVALAAAREALRKAGVLALSTFSQGSPEWAAAETMHNAILARLDGQGDTEGADG